MKAIKFTLSGKTAMFKKPDVNAFVYFTYSHIHKIALFGVLGAIIGLGGYTQQNNTNLKENKREKYPEFYSKLQNLKIAIQPDLKDKGYFVKKIQTFNNSVGYASQEEGGNLIVREQWLENPKWRIYILDNKEIDDDIFKKLHNYMLNHQSMYFPYLGKNEHPASINHCEYIELCESKDNYITSLFPSKNIQIDNCFSHNNKSVYIFREKMPVRINEELNFYEYEELMMTNCEIVSLENDQNLYADGEYRLVFF